MTARRTVVVTDEHRARRRAWVDELRTGLPQTHGQLRTYDERAHNARAAYCCLGVAEQIRGARWVVSHVGHWTTTDDQDNYSLLSRAARDWYGLEPTDPYVVWNGGKRTGGRAVVRTLSALNDDEHLTLDKIADVIEQQGDDWDGTYEYALTQQEYQNAVSAAQATRPRPARPS